MVYRWSRSTDGEKVEAMSEAFDFYTYELEDISMEDVLGAPIPEPAPEHELTPEEKEKEKEKEKERDTQPRLNLDEKIEVDGIPREIELHDCGLYVFKAGEHFAPPPPSPSNVIGVTMPSKENNDVLIASSHNKYAPSGLIAPISKGYKTVHLSAAVGLALTKQVK